MSPDLIARRTRVLAKDFTCACEAHRAASDRLAAAQRRHNRAPGSIEQRQAVSMSAAVRLAQQALADQQRYAEALALIAKCALLLLAEAVGAAEAAAT
jgi:hypothetical protein